MSSLSRVMSQVEKVCDFIPIVSTVSNGLELIAKVALCALRKYSSLLKDIDLTYLEKKEPGACLLLAIPFLNVPFAYVRHCYTPDIPRQRADTSPSIETTSSPGVCPQEAQEWRRQIARGQQASEELAKVEEAWDKWPQRLEERIQQLKQKGRNLVASKNPPSIPARS